MDFDIVFQHAFATADLTSIMKVLKNDSKIDTQSENFRLVVELSIKNGEEVVFASLLRHMPDLTLRARSQAVKHSQQHFFLQGLWTILRQLAFSVVTEGLFISFCYYALYRILLYAILQSSGQISEASARWYNHLQNSPSPFSAWVSLLVFYGIRQRFSRKFLLDSLDTGLVFLWLAIATRFVPPSSWIGDCIYQGNASLLSVKGLQIRNMLNRYMPSWRRKYFAIVLGPDHALAESTQAKASAPLGDYSRSILSQLLRSNCNEKALMLQYLEMAGFDDINENCGAGHEILIWAAWKGYLPVLQRLLSLGIDANIVLTDTHATRPRGTPLGSALFWAAAKGHTDIVEALLLHKAEVANDDPEFSPLMGATMNSYRLYDRKAMLKYVQCVTHLLQAGANPNAIDKEGRSALSWSTQPIQKPILDLLLNAGADPNVADQQLMLPLHYAAQHSSSQQVVRILLAKTVNINSLDKDGTSAFTWALCRSDCSSAMEFLLDATTNVVLGGGIYGYPLEAASRYCSSKTIRTLLDRGADPKATGGCYGSCIAALLNRPFNDPVLEDDLLCLELLLSNGAQANLRMNNGKQALHVAARYCWRPKIFEMLLHYGADVNAAFQVHQQDSEIATTALGILCDFSIREEATMVILKAGASPNCYTPSGKTVLQSACGILGSSKIAREFIIRGADIGATSLWEGTTALHDAATVARSDMIKVLIEKGANVDACNKWKRTPLRSACWRTWDRDTQQEKVENPFEARTRLHHTKKKSQLLHSIELLLVLGHADPKARDEDGATPLHHAVKACNPMTVEALIRLTSNEIMFERDFEGKLPLHWAVEAGFTDGLHTLINVHSHFDAAHGSTENEEARVAMQLLRKYINATDNSGNTALHYAAKKGHDKFIAQLLQFENLTDVNARNHDGQTALDIAKINKQVWVVGKLKLAQE